MDSQDYSVPLPVSRACFDEIRDRLKAGQRTLGVTDGRIDMRGVVLVVADAATVTIDATEERNPIRERFDARVSPIPGIVRFAPHGSTFGVEYAGWHYSGVPVRIDWGNDVAVFDLPASWRQTRLPGEIARTR